MHSAAHPVYCLILNLRSDTPMKRDVALKEAKWLVEPGCVVLVTTGTMERANIMTFSWQTPLRSGEPCLVQLVINPNRYTYELIKQNKELVINVPGEELINEVHLAGITSGRRVDKFKEFGLTPLPAAVEVAAYHIAREALTNVVRHARASRCTLRLVVGDGHLRLSVEDDGQSFATDVPAGVGFSSMRERAAELGGTCTIEARPGAGTHVTAVLPLDA